MCRLSAAGRIVEVSRSDSSRGHNFGLDLGLSVNLIVTTIGSVQLVPNCRVIFLATVRPRTVHECSDHWLRVISVRC